MSSQKTIKLSIVFPCLNEENSIEKCILDAQEACTQKGITAELIVADNGSTDKSIEIAQKLGARVVSVKQRGYGAAVHGGILAARGEYVAFCDADNSYSPKYFPLLLEEITKSGVDLVLANRLKSNILPGAMPFLNRYLGTPVLSALIRFCFSLPVYDCNSGMRILKRGKYEQLNLSCPGMAYASEMLCASAQEKWTYREWTMPIFYKDNRNKPPHLRRWRDGWQHLVTILKMFVKGKKRW